MTKIYDVIIIWAGASWLFAWIHLPQNLSKLILEKNARPWVKVLLSGWERANVTNMYIDTQNDYFGQNTKALHSFYKKYNNYDLMWFFAENWINIIEEDRWRMILESWNSRELLELLLHLNKKNNTKIQNNSEVKFIKKEDEIFEIKISWKEIFHSKNLIITTWWKSFFQVWTSGDWYSWAKDFWHTVIQPQKWLCGIVTKKDLSDISGSSCEVNLEVIDKNTKKTIYWEIWPILFTHFWVTWPIIHNSTVAIWNYINSLDLTEFIQNLNLEKIPESEKNDYIFSKFLSKNIFLKINFASQNFSKKISKFFDLDIEENLIQYFYLQDFRSRREAKVTTWWIKLDELDNNLQSKSTNNLYFWWEILDITGKTWWYNLQFCWTTWIIIAQNFAKK